MIKPFSPIFFPAVLLLGMLPAMDLAAQNIVAPNTPAGGSTPPSTAPAVSTVTPYEVSHNRRLVSAANQNTDNVKAQGNFGAQVWLVADRQFFENWKKPETPSIDPVNIAQRGVPIYTAVIFYGIGHQAGGNANVTYTMTVRRPNGSVYEQRLDAIGWQNLAPTDDKQLILGRDSLAISVGPDEPAGLYTVDVIVRDNVARVDLPLKANFVVQ